MKKNIKDASVATLYDDYVSRRDIRPSADLEPMLKAANDSYATGDSHNTGNVIDTAIAWEESEEAKAISLLYRQWRTTSVTADELEAVRERVIHNTLAIAAATSSAGLRSTTSVARPGLVDRIKASLGNAFGDVGLVPVGVAAAVAALAIFVAPMNNTSDVDTAGLAGISVMSVEQLADASDLSTHVSTGLDANLGFSKTSSRTGRAFGLGVGSMDLVMALRSGNADKTLEVTRHLVGLSQTSELRSIKTSATAVYDEISLRPEVSRVVFSRSMQLLTQMKNTFVSDDDRMVFELGQWVEAVYLLSSNGISTGDTSGLHQTLTSAQASLRQGSSLKGLSRPVADDLASLAKINVSDGIVLSEARMARDLSARIKSLID